MPTVVLGYVPKPEGEAALAASISEARLRQADLVVVNAHRANHGHTDKAELDDVRARVEAAGVVVDVRQPETGLEASEDLLSIAEEVRRRADRHRPAPAYPRRQADPGQQRPAHPPRRVLPGPGGQVGLTGPSTRRPLG